jgi:ABC-type Mn2+/Zn2+ transport system permease subunit
VDWFHQIVVQPVADYQFMRVAMITAMVVGLTVGMVSCLMVVRRSVMMGDALGHAVLPGVVVGWIVAGQAGVLLGAVTMAMAIGACTAYVERTRKLAMDSALGVMFSASFAAGLALVSWLRPRGFSLDTLLLGNILGTNSTDLWITVVGGIAATLLVVVAFRALRAWSFDPDVAAALGVPVGVLRYVSYTLIGLTVVIALNTVGIVLVVALVAIPGSTARLLTNRLAVMMVLASGIGLLGAVSGMYGSYHLDIAAGPSIALSLGLMFAFTFVLAPRTGVLTRWLTVRRVLSSRNSEDLLLGLSRASDSTRTPVRVSAVAATLGMDHHPGATDGTPTLPGLAQLERQGLVVVQDDQVWLTVGGLEAAGRLAPRQHQRFAERNDSSGVSRPVTGAATTARPRGDTHTASVESAQRHDN